MKLHPFPAQKLKKTEKFEHEEGMTRQLFDPLELFVTDRSILYLHLTIEGVKRVHLRIADCLLSSE